MAMEDGPAPVDPRAWHIPATMVAAVATLTANVQALAARTDTRFDGVEETQRQILGHTTGLYDRVKKVETLLHDGEVEEKVWQKFAKDQEHKRGVQMRWLGLVITLAGVGAGGINVLVG